ncbi:MAG TPA: hypothetical protein PKZ64_00575 [Spirochaetota bacterium]|nr:hypothetical protein [Spirochaetota bacterium]
MTAINSFISEPSTFCTLIVIPPLFFTLSHEKAGNNAAVINIQNKISGYNLFIDYLNSGSFEKPAGFFYLQLIIITGDTVD